MMKSATKYLHVIMLCSKELKMLLKHFHFLTSSFFFLNSAKFCSLKFYRKRIVFYK